MVQELYEKYLYFQAQLCHSEKFYSYSFTLRKEYYENIEKVKQIQKNTREIYPKLVIVIFYSFKVAYVIINMTF